MRRVVVVKVLANLGVKTGDGAAAQPRPIATGASTAFRALLEGSSPVVTPGIFDPLSAILTEKAGFEAGLISSFAMSASMGMADVGLVTLSECIERSGRIANVTSIPIICDIDTGFGNYLTAMRAVRELEKAGLAGVVIEDQLTPPGRVGRPMISSEEMIEKIRAVVEARSNPDFIIAVRTDAAPVMGLKEAIRRGQAYVDAGADAFLAIDVDSEDNMRVVIREVGAPCIATISLPHPPLLSVAKLESIGFKWVIPSLPPLFAAVKAMWDVLSELRKSGDANKTLSALASTSFVTDLLGLRQIRDLEKRFLGIEQGFSPW
jgi:2-methylisocitrate lyase-like PEP mutase family enzyme